MLLLSFLFENSKKRKKYILLPFSYFYFSLSSCPASLSLPLPLRHTPLPTGPTPSVLLSSNSQSCGGGFSFRFVLASPSDASQSSVPPSRCSLDNLQAETGFFSRSVPCQSFPRNHLFLQWVPLSDACVSGADQPLCSTAETGPGAGGLRASHSNSPRVLPHQPLQGNLLPGLH